MDIQRLNQLAPPGWQGKYPPCRIQVDQEGALFHDGAPIIHPKVLQTIYESVRLDEGGYYLEVDGRRCQLEVVDTFFVVKRAELSGGVIELRISGGASEPIDSKSLWVGERDILYCRVRGGAFPARFLRAAYYQLAEWIGQDEAGFHLKVNGKSYPIIYR